MQGQKKSRKGYHRDVSILDMVPAANGSELMMLMRAVTDGAGRRRGAAQHKI